MRARIRKSVYGRGWTALLIADAPDGCRIVSCEMCGFGSWRGALSWALGMLQLRAQ